MAIPFDAGRLQVGGSAQPVREGIAAIGGLHLFAVSDSGTLVYFPGAELFTELWRLVWVDREGREGPISSAPPRRYSALELSPDGRQIAVQINGAGPVTADISVYDLDRGTLERRTFSERAFNPVWTKERLLYREGDQPRSALVSVDANNTTSSPTMLTDPDASSCCFRHRCRRTTRCSLVREAWDPAIRGSSCRWILPLLIRSRGRSSIGKGRRRASSSHLMGDGWPTRRPKRADPKST